MVDFGAWDRPGVRVSQGYLSWCARGVSERYRKLVQPKTEHFGERKLHDGSFGPLVAFATRENRSCEWIRNGTTRKYILDPKELANILKNNLLAATAPHEVFGTRSVPAIETDNPDVDRFFLQVVQDADIHVVNYISVPRRS
ncbi:hypothetical protein BC936DRAFT_139908 [Jimgerdemannia flammicorona]|uniref:Uncharacterized protein n=1 Tax=Jimgerdemannia flammicorona TaxID=994334 RepID=A0A433B8X4_9FUNG|nr:hypothetical protein BC936DRAFT_139908 [Jimgerdemannia flammicorona]